MSWFCGFNIRAIFSLPTLSGLNSLLEENEVIDFLSPDFFNSLEVSLLLLLGFHEQALNSFLQFETSLPSICIEDFGLEHRFAEVFKTEPEGS